MVVPLLMPKRADFVAESNAVIELRDHVAAFLLVVANGQYLDCVNNTFRNALHPDANRYRRGDIFDSNNARDSKNDL
jgi:hypothetical protein